MTRILCSAIWYDDGNDYAHQPRNITHGFVICGRRHHNCIATMIALKCPKDKMAIMKKTQGFLTDEDRFVDRQDAGRIAWRSGQIDMLTDKLFSEDLW